MFVSMTQKRQQQKFQQTINFNHVRHKIKPIETPFKLTNTKMQSLNITFCSNFEQTIFKGTEIFYLPN